MTDPMPARRNSKLPAALTAPQAPEKLRDAVDDLRGACVAVQDLNGDVDATLQTAVVCTGTTWAEATTAASTASPSSSPGPSSRPRRRAHEDPRARCGGLRAPQTICVFGKVQRLTDLKRLYCHDRIDIDRGGLHEQAGHELGLNRTIRAPVIRGRAGATDEADIGTSVHPGAPARQGGPDATTDRHFTWV